MIEVLLPEALAMSRAAELEIGRSGIEAPIRSVQAAAEDGDEPLSYLGGCYDPPT